ncbi:hypothetical protein DRO02_03055 [archaeon]|nr:MAG: hypothetical protein DRO02_03055 [archaeon]
MVTKAVLFDLDGTLVDNELYERENIKALVRIASKNTSLNEKEIWQKVREYRKYEGTPLWYDWRYFTKFIGAPEDSWRQVHSENLKHLKLLPGVIETLEKLKSMSVSLGIVTDAIRDVALLKIKHLKIKKFFKVIVTQDDVGTVKPDPYPILYALKLLDMSPNEAIYVGNTLNDVLAALAAGVKPILYNTNIDGHAIITRRKQTIGAPSNVPTISSIEQILEYV